MHRILELWKKVDLSWYSSTTSAGVTITKSESNGHLVISGSVTNAGCSPSSTGSASIVYIKGYWTKIRYKQEFRGTASCWRIFGNVNWNQSYGGNVGKINHGLFAFDKTLDTISNEYYMQGFSGHKFTGATATCNNKDNNFWHAKASVELRYATVTLRRNPAIASAGIFTSTSCGTPTYVIKDINVFF
ncbi:hypothetical protein QZH41_017211 [Actinostola sp. cb2023]|nr:hypothetical protein QZH41_017211 [Actinostola sp. cb2023]